MNYISKVLLSWWTACLHHRHLVSRASSLSLKRRAFLTAQYSTACYVIKGFLRLTGTQLWMSFLFSN